ncbi:unnamed protein product, partial [marine sediment metagenome]
MANKQVSSELKRYFHEMKNDATSHDKVFLLITIAILVGCGVGSFRNLSATVHWPKATFALAAIILGVTVWLASF